MNQPSFGKKLGEIRKANGLTQEELAEKCNFTVRTIQRIESGAVNPRSFTIKILSAKLGYDFLETSDFKADSEKVNHDSKLKWFKSFLWYGIDLFNLKTDTMKKVTILSILSISIGMGFLMLSNESKAQNSKSIDYSKFTKSVSRGIIYFFPKGESFYISNIKDTADYKSNRDLIQEYKNKIFLNGKFIGKALNSDTVIYKSGEVIIKPSFWKFTSSTGKGINYLIPNGTPIDNLVVHVDTEYIFIGKHQIQEYEYKIFLDGIKQGLVKYGDTIIYKDGKIKILK